MSAKALGIERAALNGERRQKGRERVEVGSKVIRIRRGGSREERFDGSVLSSRRVESRSTRRTHPIPVKARRTRRHSLFGEKGKARERMPSHAKPTMKTS